MHTNIGFQFFRDFNIIFDINVELGYLADIVSGIDVFGGEVRIFKCDGTGFKSMMRDADACLDIMFGSRNKIEIIFLTHIINT